MLFVNEEGVPEVEGRTTGGVPRGLSSSITASTERNLDSAFLTVVGTLCLREAPLGGDEPREGDGVEFAGEVERGGVAVGEDTEAHSANSGL